MNDRNDYTVTCDDCGAEDSVGADVLAGKGVPRRCFECGGSDVVVELDGYTVSDTVYVVVAGKSYSHAPPRAVFTTKRAARQYRDTRDSTDKDDWTKIEEVPIDPED